MKISVILPSFNGGKYIKQSISSILNQSYSDFELIILDDGSVDQTKNIVLGFNDRRIKFIEFKTRQGLINSLNVGIDEAKGQFIARMDSDDIAFKDRFLKQLMLMDANPKAIVCGSAIAGIGINRRTTIFPTNFLDIRAALPVTTPIAHPTVMMRADPMRDVGYSNIAVNAEDYQLWWDATQFGEIINSSEPLLYYRYHATQASSINSNKVALMTARISIEKLSRLGIITNEQQKLLHLNALTFQHAANMEDAYEVGKWIDYLRDKFQESEVVDDIYRRFWRRYCIQQIHLGRSIYDLFFSVKFTQKNDMLLSKTILFSALYFGVKSTSTPIRILRNIVKII